MTDTNNTDETNVDAYLRHHFRQEPMVGKRPTARHALAEQDTSDEGDDAAAGVYPVPVPHGRID